MATAKKKTTTKAKSKNSNNKSVSSADTKKMLGKRQDLYGDDMDKQSVSSAVIKNASVAPKLSKD